MTEYTIWFKTEEGADLAAVILPILRPNLVASDSYVIEQAGADVAADIYSRGDISQLLKYLYTTLEYTYPGLEFTIEYADSLHLSNVQTYVP